LESPLEELVELEEVPAVELDAGALSLLVFDDELSPDEVDPPLFTEPALPAALLPA
jgi:hypothetical protein